LSCERLGLLDQALPVGEGTAEPLDPSELRQDFSPSDGGGLLRQLLPQPCLRRIQVAEVPERAQAVGHESTLRTPHGDPRGSRALVLQRPQSASTSSRSSTSPASLSTGPQAAIP